MNPVDLEQLEGHRQGLFRIAESLESLCKRDNAQDFSRLLRVAAEMHDHLAEIADIIELNSPRARRVEVGFGDVDADKAASVR